MADLTSWLTPSSLAPVITSVIGVVGAISAAAYTRFTSSIDSNHARRLAVLDFTQKRLDLQKQLLELELTVADQDTRAQEKARRRAEDAIKRITGEADMLMQGLGWKNQITSALLKRPNLLTRKRLSRGERFSLSEYSTR